MVAIVYFMCCKHFLVSVLVLHFLAECISWWMYIISFDVVKIIILICYVLHFYLSCWRKFSLFWRCVGVILYFWLKVKFLLMLVICTESIFISWICQYIFISFHIDTNHPNIICWIVHPLPTDLQYYFVIYTVSIHAWACSWAFKS